MEYYKGTRLSVQSITLFKSLFSRSIYKSFIGMIVYYSLRPKFNNSSEDIGLVSRQNVYMKIIVLIIVSGSNFHITYYRICEYYTTHVDNGEHNAISEVIIGNH